MTARSSSRRACRRSRSCGRSQVAVTVSCDGDLLRGLRCCWKILELPLHLLADFGLQLRLVLEAADPVQKLARQLGQLAVLDGDDLQRQIDFLAAERFVFRFGRDRQLRLDRVAGLLADQQLVEAFQLGVGQAQRRLDLDRLFGELRDLLAVVRWPAA